MSKLKVLMMGGRRCGKTSALASMFDQMTNGQTNKILTVADMTPPQIHKDEETGQEEKIDNLNIKKLELVDFINKNANNTFLVDQNPTKFSWDYNLQVKIPGTTKSMEIEFRDVPGEFFDSDIRTQTQKKGYDETYAYSQNCDVFVVVIDTPYLMDDNDAVSEAANLINPLHRFLANTRKEGDKRYKKVIFVPIKCEYWIKEGKIDEVVEKVRLKYNASIQELTSNQNTEVSILPIETAGDILFDALRDCYLLTNPLTNTTQKCARVSDNMVLLQNGRHHKVKDFEILNEDYKAVFPGGHIQRPAEWFHLRNDQQPKYNPHNCEQLPLHIIRFMFSKAKKEAVDPTILKLLNIPFLGDFLGRILEALGFGTIGASDLQDALDKLSSQNLIKDHGDGITAIQTCF